MVGPREREPRRAVMRIVLHIGADAVIADRIQRVLATKRAGLLRKGVLLPDFLGGHNHDLLWHALGTSQQARIADQLDAAIARHQPDILILTAHQLASQATDRQIAALHDLLASRGDPVTVLAHFDQPARMLAHRYAAQVLSGRVTPLDLELGLIAQNSPRSAIAAAWDTAKDTLYPEAERAPLWLDSAGLAAAWGAAFGVGALRLAAADPELLWGPEATTLIARDFGLPHKMGQADPAPLPRAPSAAWVARARQFNRVLALWSAKKKIRVPRPAHAKLVREFAVAGLEINPGTLGLVTERLGPALADLAKAHPDLVAALPSVEPGDAPWAEADPRMGFRATQYLWAFAPRLERAAREAAREAPAPEDADSALGPVARAKMPDAAKQKFLSLRRSIYAPHDRFAPPNGSEPAFAPTAQSGTGRTIVACVKNEAPYILEWLAHHRAIGFDRFVIYSNDCSDGSDTMLDRLDAMGLITHKDNSGWTGSSPQQYALDDAMRDPAVTSAAWVAHIDIDEFVNIQTGQGTLDDLFRATPDATHIAMTWRLFGHAGIEQFSDEPVTAQFTKAAPRHLPKPHIAWGFKTLGQNIGAYGKLSCHRPNRLRPEAEPNVHWVNGAGRPMPHSLRRRGWRSGRDTIGYDLVQLNHYATRSLESFLIKRQRGRALHTDRTIGLNYWLRMDWNDHEDRSILRHHPRTADAIAHLMQDETLAQLHRAAVDWHRAKAAELRADPGFAALFEQARDLKLSAMERAAWALSLDMET